MLALLLAGDGYTALLQVPMEPLMATARSGPQPSTRQELCLNGEWRFAPIYDAQQLASSELLKLPPIPTNGWGVIRVPGKWKQVSGQEAVDSFGYPREWTRANRGWYQRNFTVPAAMRGQRVKLHFGAVLVYTEVLVNGQPAGKHLGGVTPFDLDITDKAQAGAVNTLAMYVVNEEAVYVNRPKSRYDFTARAPIYYPYSQGSAGIWQDVFLVGLPAVFVDNVFAKTSWREKKITAEIELRNEATANSNLTVMVEVETTKGTPVRELGRRQISTSAANTVKFSIESDWPDARLWSPEEPNLYLLHTKLFAGNMLVDEHYQRFGFREFWIQGHDFFLNGRWLSLFGDWVGVLGCGKDANLRPEYCRAYVRYLKGMNYLGTRLEAVGTVPAMLEACDELGLPITATGISDSAGFFDRGCVAEALAHAKADMLDWLRRDRNHPCILLWSTENEDQPAGLPKAAFKNYQEIDRVFIENDPTRPFLHDGAAPTIARSDADGWAPILCPHYVFGSYSFGERLRQFEGWRTTSSKPLVCGEENVGRDEDSGGYLWRMMGDRMYGDLAERDALWGWYIKRVIGAWRSFSVSGIIAHGNHIHSGNSPICAAVARDAEVSRFWGKPVAEFQWQKLDSPFAKPKYLLGSNLEWVNPWLPGIPETMPSPLYAATRDAFNPVLVTLSRAVEHNYCSLEKWEKQVFLINEGPGALKECQLTWELRAETDGKILQSGSRQVNLAQGEIRGEKVEWQIPTVTNTETAILKVVLLDKTGAILSRDEMQLSFYPPLSAPNLETTQVILFDVRGRESRTAQALSNLGITFRRISAIEEAQNLAQGNLLLIGAGAVTSEVTSNEALLKNHLERGGRLLVFEQPMAERCARSFAFVKAVDHPIFRGLASPCLSLWRTSGNNVALGALQLSSTGRNVVLADLAGRPVLAETRFGKGPLIACNLQLIEGCLAGEPEARLLTRNLLSYLAVAPASGPAPVSYTGEETMARLLQENLRVSDLKSWKPGEALPSGGLLVVGTKAKELAAHTGEIDSFVRTGGTVLYLGNPDASRLRWLPEPIDVQPISAAYLLRKKSNVQFLDGLGEIALMDSPHAANYFVADAIPGVTNGFRIPANGHWQSWYQICDRETSEYQGLRRRPYYWESKAAAVVCLEHGRGRYILAALPAKGNPVTMRFLSAFLANYKVPSSDSRCFLFFSGLANDQGLRRAGAREWRGFARIDLVPHCNMLFNDEVAGDRKGGWDDSGENDLRNLPSGDLLLNAVPFHIIDVSHDDPYEDLAIRLGHPIRACIVLKGAARPYFPERAQGIAINQKLRRLNFLHTATYCSGAAGQPIGRYLIRYANGQSTEIVLRKGGNIDDWTNVGKGNLSAARVGWTGSNSEYPRVGLYLMPWQNPRPEQEISTIDFLSEGTAVPILIAITGVK